MWKHKASNYTNLGFAETFDFVVIGEVRRTVIVAFNANDQLQWSALFGETGISNGMSLDAAGYKLYLSGMADDGYIFLDYIEGSELDYYQGTQFGNDNDAGLARFCLSLITSISESSDEHLQLIVYPNPSNGVKHFCSYLFTLQIVYSNALLYL